MTNRLCVSIAEAIIKNNRQAGLCFLREGEVSMYCQHAYLSDQMEARGEAFRQSHTFTGQNGTYFSAVICCLGHLNFTHGMCKSRFSAAVDSRRYFLFFFILFVS